MSEQFEDLYNIVDTLISERQEPEPTNPVDPGPRIADLFPEMSVRLRNGLRWWQEARYWANGASKGPFFYWSEISWHISENAQNWPQINCGIIAFAKGSQNRDTGFKPGPKK